MGTLAFNVLPPPDMLSRDLECIRVAKHNALQVRAMYDHTSCTQGQTTRRTVKLEAAS